jgi:outer membrane protein TolC
MPRHIHPLASTACVSALAALLGACASFSPDAGLGPATSVAFAELGKDVAKVSTEADAGNVQGRVDALMRRPLTADGAVQIALLKNRGLQAAFNDLGVSEAQYVQATLPPVPRLSLSNQGGDFSIEVTRSAVVSLIELATLPARAAVAEKRFQSAQYRAAEAVVRLAADTRRQFFTTVAANQSVGFLEQALASAESASTLATSLGETGALNKLEQAREHAFYVELGAQLAKARVEQRVEREKLVRQLGLWGRELDFKLPGSLPPLPGRLPPGKTLEAQALEKRVDLRMARLDLEALTGQYGLTSVSGFINAAEIGYGDDFERTKSFRTTDAGVEVDREKTFRRGVSLDLTIPIYDFGQTAVRGAKEAYLAAANRLAQRAVNARSQVREAYLRYRGNYDIARHYQSTVLPLRKTIQDQALLQYSGMLIDVAQLIVDARARILSNIQAIEARRDFWIAATDLKAAVIGGVADSGAGEASSPAPSLASATPD